MHLTGSLARPLVTRDSLQSLSDHRPRPPRDRKNLARIGPGKSSLQAIDQPIDSHSFLLISLHLAS
ncbi:hypothetical protein AWC22_16640 [Mycobacterium riyadhense]|uniref:Uncharacterized protein n=1 Tax=Mycobacterium riyadhense TaxID=486698 RepID=A0A1X2D1A1_9MYCO|nr:hypothetical protein AWC22_16640 [Mycobacterium riyadhense]